VTCYPRRVRAHPLATLLILGLVFATTGALAWDGPTLHQATASLTFQLFGDASPSPACWLDWEEAVDGFPYEAPPIHRIHVEEDEPCTSTWLVRCDVEGLAYEGSWPEIDPEFWGWNFQSYTAEIVARLYFPDTTRLLAERDVAGALSIDEHLVTYATISGPDTELLGVETEDTVEILLEPGAYWITLTVHAHESGTHYAYDGSVRVWWEDPELVAAEISSWGAVKALYQ
jgi:hypothetical protein